MGLILLAVLGMFVVILGLGVGLIALDWYLQQQDGERVFEERTRHE